MNLSAKLHRTVDAAMHWPLIGPVLQRQALRSFVENRDQNLFFGIHDSWETAEAAARAFGQAGYDNSASAQLYDQRVRIDAQDYPAMYWLQRSLQDGLRSVFDIGGAVGIKFLAFQELLGAYPGVTWRVCDVPAMVEHGRELSARRGDQDRLSFTSRPEDGDGAEVFFASGVLQYLPRTLGDIVAGFARKPRRILINTAAIHPEFDFFTVNSIGTAFCPYRVQTQATLMRSLKPLGYKMRETWVNPGKAMVIPTHPGHSLSNYSGYCFDLVERA